MVMIESLFKFLAKKYIVNIVNDVLDNINKKIDIEIYRQKILSVMRFLNDLLNYLDDKKIDETEADHIIEKAKDLFD